MRQGTVTWNGVTTAIGLVTSLGTVAAHATIDAQDRVHRVITAEGKTQGRAHARLAIGGVETPMKVEGGAHHADELTAEIVGTRNTIEAGVDLTKGTAKTITKLRRVGIRLLVSWRVYRFYLDRKDWSRHRSESPARSDRNGQNARHGAAREERQSANVSNDAVQKNAEQPVSVQGEVPEVTSH